MERYVINVWNGRAGVARYEAVGEYAWTYRVASNWEALEDEAMEAVYAQGGAANLSGLYFCPASLASKAYWEGEGGKAVAQA